MARADIMIRFQQLLYQRAGRVAVSTLFLWGNVFNVVGRSQTLALWKPCFAETDDLPSAPLSQTEFSTPSLWLEKDIYSDVIQATRNPSLGNTVDTEVDETIETQLEAEKSEILPPIEPETVDTEVDEIVETQLEAEKSEILPPIDLIQSEDQLLTTWFTQNKIWPQSSTNFVRDQLVTLVVNRQKWQAERYVGQYVFMNRFGTTAREYGYNLRVCNEKGESLGYYYCELEKTPIDCNISLRSEGFRLRDFRVFEVISPP
ncbi:MAG: hypothetical protein WBA13_21735 [Microcoleaceae cyanobacterium]